MVGPTFTRRKKLSPLPNSADNIGLFLTEGYSMNCKKGDLAKTVAPAAIELRGKFVTTVELVYSFSGGKVEPAWIVDRSFTYTCSTCGFRHETDRFLDIELRPLPGLDPDLAEEHEHELTAV